MFSLVTDQIENENICKVTTSVGNKSLKNKEQEVSDIIQTWHKEFVTM